MDSQKFADFFGNVPVYTIPGRTFPVDTLVIIFIGANLRLSIKVILSSSLFETNNIFSLHMLVSSKKLFARSRDALFSQYIKNIYV